MAAPAKSASGTIYDIGYQRYEGHRLGRPYAVRSLFAHGLRTVFAIGRGSRARSVPLALGALALIPAALQAAMAAYTDNQLQLITYWTYFFNLAMIFALFCAAQAPELVSADLRTRSLVLYLARALRREDYVLAKVLSLATAVFLLTVVPLLILFAGRVFSAAEPWGAFRAELGSLGPIFGSSVVVGLMMAGIAVAMSAFTPRRALASAAVIGYFIILSALVEILMESISAGWDRWLALLNPILTLGGFAVWIFGAEPPARSPFAELGLPGWSWGAACLGYVVLSLGALLIRYRRIDP